MRLEHNRDHLNGPISSATDFYASLLAHFGRYQLVFNDVTSLTPLIGINPGSCGLWRLAARFFPTIRAEASTSHVDTVALHQCSGCIYPDCIGLINTRRGARHVGLSIPHS